MKYLKKYENFNSDEKYSSDLIIKKGHLLFHSSVEEFNTTLNVGSYDKILWTAEDSGISQTYIPVSSRIFTSTSNIIAPKKEKYDRNIQKQLGIEYDYDSVKWDGNRAASYNTPQIFKNINDEYYDKRNEYYKIKKEFDEIEKEYINDETDNKDLLIKLKNYKNKINELEKEVYGSNSLEKKQNDIINKKLIEEFGYKPTDDSSYNSNYSWELKYETENGVQKLMPANYRSKGRLFIIKPKRDLKIFDYSNGEGDLTNVDSHKIDLFRKVEEKGYDGIKIDDFAQVESEGNFGHTSIGLFKNTIKDLDIEIIEGVTHPDKNDFERMWREQDWRSKEYKEYSK